MKKRIISIILILLLCLTCLPVSVFADDSSTTDIESIMEQAEAFLKAGEYEEAIPLLTEAADLGNAIAQYNLGSCYAFGYGVDQDYKKATAYFRLAANQGLDEAQYNLGVSYYYGYGVDQSYDEALKYFALAAEQGIPEAMCGVGSCYYAKNDWAQAAEWYIKALDAGYEPDEEEEGHIADVAEKLVEQAWTFLRAGDYEAAIPLLKEAAALGNADAQASLGYCYYSGEGVEQNYDEALKYLKLAADQDDAFAMFGIGECYYGGKGVEKNWSTAAEWYQKAFDAGYEPDEEDIGHIADVAEKLADIAKAFLDAGDYEAAIPLLMEAADLGSGRAQNNLGACYQNGFGVDQDYEKAVEYYRLAADQGLAVAQDNLGDCYYYGFGVDQDYEKAVEYYRLAADQGLAMAQNNLGACYENGFGVEQDYEKAVEYYRLAADQGFARAQFNLGACYEFGYGIEQNYEKAVEYYRLSADQGDAFGQTNLGYCYLKGNGVEQDYDEALKWFVLSAEQGDEYGMFGIGDCYYGGKGVEKDWTQAAEWYIKALEAGYEPDEEDKVHLAEVLTSRFTDVNETDWYYDSVGYVAGRGIMTGMRADYFGATEKLSRGQFATVLYRMAGKPEADYEDVFPDVNESDWFGVPVSWAAEIGVVTGYKNGKFGPADDITREQIAVMLYRYAEYMEYDTSEKADLSKYPDKKSVSSWAKDAMEWAVGAGIIQGQDGGKKLAPQKEACRAACATMIMRFCEKYAG